MAPDYGNWKESHGDLVDDEGEYVALHNPTILRHIVACNNALRCRAPAKLRALEEASRGRGRLSPLSVRGGCCDTASPARVSDGGWP